MKTDERQIAFIRGYLIENGVSSYALQEDLLDHFCCTIEDEMENGKSFDRSFSSAVDRIAPEGPEEIQKDLNYLLTIKKKVMLRKLVFMTSYVSVLIILVGLALRIPQIVSADLTLLMIMAGMLLFSVTTVPYLFYDRYQKSIQELKSQ